MSNKVGKPDWTKWGQTKSIALWQAALLCLDIDPDGVKFRPNECKDGQAPLNLRATQHRDYINRLKNLLSMISRPGNPAQLNLLPSRSDKKNSVPNALGRVDFLKFADAVATSTGWDVPDALRQIGQDQHPPESRPSEIKKGGVNVWLPHTTKALSATLEVMCKHWQDYDPSNPPKQTVIAREIDAALGRKYRSGAEPSRLAKALACAIRPDRLSEEDMRKSRRRNS